MNSASEFIFGGADNANGVGRNPSICTLQDDVKVLKQSLEMEHLNSQKELKILKQNHEIEAWKLNNVRI